MCADENIPSINRIEQITHTLRAYEERAPEEGQDIFSIDRHHGPVHTVDEIINVENYITNNLNVARFRENQLNNGRVSMVFELPSDYENIFEQPGLSRRSAREIPSDDHDPSLNGQEELMWDWLSLCLEDPNRSADKYHPGDMSVWEHIMKHDIPARLDFNSWIVDHMMEEIDRDLEGEIPGISDVEYGLQEWREWMGQDEVLFQRSPNGRHHELVCFFGEAMPGRLVWLPTRKFPMPFGRSRGLGFVIRAKPREAEEALVALARRVARHVASCIVYQYALPEFERRGYGILNRKQIGRAVREILGDAWFDLPFDVDGSLRKWSEDDVLKPDDQIRGLDVFIDHYDG